MKVTELIEKLKKLDGDLEVFVSGYEGGYNDISDDIIITKFKKNVNTEWYYGNHEIDKNGDVKGIVLK